VEEKECQSNNGIEDIFRLVMMLFLLFCVVLRFVVGLIVVLVVVEEFHTQIPDDAADFVNESNNERHEAESEEEIPMFAVLGQVLLVPSVCDRRQAEAAEDEERNGRTKKLDERSEGRHP